MVSDLPVPEIQLGSAIVREGGRPYVIAEVGVNHEGSLTRAFGMIEAAAEAGASAVKFQTYKANLLASRFSPSYWDTSKEPQQSQFDLFSKFDVFEPEDYESLAEKCRDSGVDFASTPFDSGAVDFLDPLVSFFKIASADITNFPLLRAIGAKIKPVIISTGASTKGEIESAIKELKRAGTPEIAIMHCILSYPTVDSQAQLGMISDIRRSFPGHVIGYSDHTAPKPDLPSLLIANTLGAMVLEKHFTDNKKAKGNDHYHAMDASDLRNFLAVNEFNRTLVGDLLLKEPTEAESDARVHARRSIVLSRDVVRGTMLNEVDLIPKRPGSGISPVHWDKVIGRVVTKDLEQDTLLDWSHFD